MIDPTILWLGSLALGALFVGSAAHKLRDLASFRAAMAGYRLVPAPLLPVAAPALALAEVVIGAATLATLFAPDTGRIGLIAAACMLLGYALAIAINLARGNSAIDCGCFGFGARGPGLRSGMIVRNIALAALALPALMPLAPRQLVWLDFVTLLAGLAVLALLNAAIDLALNLPRKEHQA